MNMSNDVITVASFYKFVELENYYDMKDPLLEVCNQHCIKGTILLADEGINATISGAEEDIDAVVSFLNQDDRLMDIELRKSRVSFLPFQKMKVKLRHESVTIRNNEVNISNRGLYVNPENWDDMIAQAKNPVIIDTRNDYEVEMGKFVDAVNPNTKFFRNFPDWAEKWSKENINSQPEVFMYCTGGVRCEKSTAYMKNLGLNNVYHLKGGILEYLKTTKNENKRWEGSCFVFDDRVAVDNNVSPVNGLRCNKCGNVLP